MVISLRKGTRGLKGQVVVQVMKMATNEGRKRKKIDKEERDREMTHENSAQ